MNKSGGGELDPLSIVDTNIYNNVIKGIEYIPL
jgi:hypothetical protein